MPKGKGTRLPGKGAKTVSISKTENGFLVQSFSYMGDVKFYNAATKEEAFTIGIMLFKKGK